MSSSPSSFENLRTLKIKTGVVKRLTKEVTMYQKEADTQSARIQSLIDSGADEHDIRKQKEVLQESLVMIPDTHQRLQAAVMELQSLQTTLQFDPQSPESIAASEVLELAKVQVEAV